MSFCVPIPFLLSRHDFLATRPARLQDLFDTGAILGLRFCVQYTRYHATCSQINIAVPSNDGKPRWLTSANDIISAPVPGLLETYIEVVHEYLPNLALLDIYTTREDISDQPCNYCQGILTAAGLIVMADNPHDTMDMVISDLLDAVDEQDQNNLDDLDITPLVAIVLPGAPALSAHQHLEFFEATQAQAKTVFAQWHAIDTDWIHTSDEPDVHIPFAPPSSEDVLHTITHFSAE